MLLQIKKFPCLPILFFLQVAGNKTIIFFGLTTVAKKNPKRLQLNIKGNEKKEHIHLLVNVLALK